MEKNPTWSVPEKRRLQKFIKRATSQNSSAPSTPSSQQSEVTSESINNELDHRSERSRLSRLKGITNRLFGAGNSNNNSTRKLKLDTSQPPVYEIETTTKAEVESTEEFFTDPVVVDQGMLLRTAVNQEIIAGNIADVSYIPRALKPNQIEDAQPAATSRDEGGMYRDDNDGKIAKADRCCFIWFC